MDILVCSSSLVWALSRRSVRLIYSPAAMRWFMLLGMDNDIFIYSLIWIKLVLTVFHCFWIIFSHANIGLCS